MRKRISTAAAALGGLALLGVVAATPANAITGGTEDTTGRYANVGLVVFYGDDGRRYRCSGTLVAPKVVLTAAHCTDGTRGKTIVTFKADVARTSAEPLPHATDYDGQTSTSGFQSAPTGWSVGQSHTHPKYSGFTDTKNWNDVAVVVLEAAPADIAPAKIAPSRYLDRFAQPHLNKTLVTLVGYGTEVRKPDSGPQKPTPMSYPIVRRYTDEVGQKLTPQILQTNSNENDNRGGGGTCFGDSGGPSFKDGYVTTVTSYGYTSNCRYLGGLQRVDIPVVQDWLRGFGVTAG